MRSKRYGRVQYPCLVSKRGFWQSRMATHVRRRPTTDSKRRFWVAIQYGSRMATHIRCRPKTGNQRKRRCLSNTCSPCYVARVSSKLKGKAPSWVCKQPSKCGSCCRKLCMTTGAACVKNTHVSTRQHICTPYLSSDIIDYEIRKKRFVCLQLQFRILFGRLCGTLAIFCFFPILRCNCRRKVIRVFLTVVREGSRRLWLLAEREQCPNSGKGDCDADDHADDHTHTKNGRQIGATR